MTVCRVQSTSMYDALADPPPIQEDHDQWRYGKPQLGSVRPEQRKRKELLEIEVVLGRRRANSSLASADVPLDRDLHVCRRRLAESECVPTTGLADVLIRCPVVPRQESGQNLPHAIHSERNRLERSHARAKEHQVRQRAN